MVIRNWWGWSIYSGIGWSVGPVFPAMMFFATSVSTKQYLKYFFQKYYHEIRELAEGGAQPNLNVGKVKSTIIPLPPTIEMKAIVEKVNALMAMCDQLEKEVQLSKTQTEQLMKSVLREVFEGDIST